MLSAIFLMLLALSLAQAQFRSEEANPKVANWSGRYFSTFYLIEDTPRGFKEFDSISVEYLPNQENDERLLIPDRHGNIPTLGRLTTKNQTSYKFKKSKLIEGGRLIKLSFVTEIVDGISYSFKGEYLRYDKEIRKGDSIIGYVHLKGNLTKYKDGRRVAQAKLDLTPHWIE